MFVFINSCCVCFLLRPIQRSVTTFTSSGRTSFISTIDDHWAALGEVKGKFAISNLLLWVSAICVISAMRSDYSFGAMLSASNLPWWRNLLSWSNPLAYLRGSIRRCNTARLVWHRESKVVRALVSIPLVGPWKVPGKSLERSRDHATNKATSKQQQNG